MQADPATLQSIANCLTQINGIDNNKRREAEAALNEGSKKQGFPTCLMALIANEGSGQTIQLAAAVNLKRYIERNWVQSDSTVALVGAEDRAAIKSSLVGLTLSVPQRLQDILSECVGVITKTDYPAQWQGLLPELVEKLNTSNFGQIIAVLKLTHALFKRYRGKYESDDIVRDVLYSVDIFAEPMLQLWMMIGQTVQSNATNGAMLTQLFHALFLLSKIFYSLNCIDLPGPFETNFETWMGSFKFYLEYENSLLANPNADEASMLTMFKSTVCDNIALLTEIAAEDITPMLPGFTQTIWTLLMKTTSDKADDILVATGIKYLTQIATQQWNSSMFADAATLKAICENIVIPNIRFRDCDGAAFELDPVEYIRNDLEGADQMTRRRAACDLVKGLCRYFREQVTQIFSSYIVTMLNEYSTNPGANWAAKDAAEYLVTALAVVGSTEKFGTTDVNAFVNVTDFFATHIINDLNPAVAVHPVLVANAIRYVITFRSQLPKDAHMTVLPALVTLLTHDSFVIHTYAAACIEKMLLVNSNGPRSPRLIAAADLGPHLEGLLTNSFTLLESATDKESQENHYIMKAIMRVMVVAGAGLAPVVETCLDKLNAILLRACANPGHPNFNHYLFESVAVLIKSVVGSKPETVAAFEAKLFPPFQQILAADVIDFLPYVFQVMSQLLEARPPPVPQPYMSLFEPLMTPALWERSGNIPAMVRLLVAFLAKGGNDIVSAGLLEPLLGVFQKLMSSTANDVHGFTLLSAIVEFVDPSAFGGHLGTILTIIFTRLASTKTYQLETALIVFMSHFMGLHGPDTFISACESIQPSIFSQLLSNIYLVNVQKIDALVDRKTCAVGMTKLITESQFFFSNCRDMWPAVLTAIINLFEAPREDTPDDVDENFGMAEAFDTKFCRLAYAQATPHDPFAAVSDPKVYLAQALHQFSKTTPNTVGGLISNLSQNHGQALISYFNTAGIAEPYLA